MQENKIMKNWMQMHIFGYIVSTQNYLEVKIMKKIEAIIRPSRLEELKTSLYDYGIKGITITQVMGSGLEKKRKEFYRGTPVNISLQPKVKIEIVVKDELVDEIVAIIMDNAKTGKSGDGKIFIYEIADALCISTSKTGNEAL